MLHLREASLAPSKGFHEPGIILVVHHGSGSLNVLLFKHTVKALLIRFM